MLHEVGQPMHAFDASLLGGSAIVVRRARAGETLRTLDGVDRKLDPSMTVIADATNAQAVAGVMGGSTSEVSDATRDIFLEVAYFDPASTRRTRRKAAALDRRELSLRARHRHRWHSARARARRATAHRRRRRTRRGRAARSLSRAQASALDSARQCASRTTARRRCTRAGHREAARAVGFTVSAFANGRAQVTVPTWRPDVSQMVDLFEEIARLRGYDSFSNELRPFRRGTVPDSSLYLLTRRVREACVSAGLLEALSMPFVHGRDDTHVRLSNPMAEDEEFSASRPARDAREVAPNTTLRSGIETCVCSKSAASSCRKRVDCPSRKCAWPR